MATTIDPVCGMQVDPQGASRTAEYNGRTYYFCSPACKKAFEAGPEQYLKSSSPGSGCSCGAIGR